MNKAYSNKALPAGTVLREWRLEEVLGVGGFGIVYKGRGIYFDELVAIKEYFPSAISERVEDATVVPVDSDAQEVHALGLKKFVEEAKLLWNLSTPTRHPNIVSVRSLFEIHGTAYMVMDFEDGVSLSRLLKQGTKFNEAAVLNLVKPVAEGLERAHRVGVLHRDIKPPNILMNDDGRPVLIDFGSARFESGEATSTKVTFHTPPYAAIEQYVKTYDQGPWTDIYAFGVVLYECVTGEKPPEVLERLHGGLGTPLVNGDWPGFSHNVLAAIDAAMTIKPSERPQSISQWLAMFDGQSLPPVVTTPVEEEDDDVTRVASFQTEEIVPVAPVETPAKVETSVPTHPKDATFKRAGVDTSASARLKDDAAAAAAVAAKAADASAGKDAAAETRPPSAADAAGPAGKDTAQPGKAAASTGKKPSPALIGGVAAAVLILGAGGWYLSSGSDAPDTSEAAETALAVVDLKSTDDLVSAMTALAEDAKGAKVPAAAAKVLDDANSAIAGLQQELAALAEQPDAGEEVAAKEAQIAAQAVQSSGQFVQALAADVDGRVRALAKDQPWADPRKTNPARSEPAARQRVAASIGTHFTQLKTAVSQAAKAETPSEAISLARQAMASFGGFNSAAASAYRTAGDTAAVDDAKLDQSAPVPTASATTSAPVSTAKGQASSLFPQKYRTFQSIVSSARSTADSVIGQHRGSEPKSSASQDEKDGYAIRKANADSARNYVNYLDTLVNSMRGERTEIEVDQLIASARETQRYLNQLDAGSRATKR